MSYLTLRKNLFNVSLIREEVNSIVWLLQIAMDSSLLARHQRQQADIPCTSHLVTL